METKHTPGPWWVDATTFGIIGGPRARKVAVVDIYSRPVTEDDESRANAAFIVRACNSHEALVEALAECERILYARHADTLSPGGREALGAVNAARAALTLARG